jgi:hypothetical protein
MTAFLGFVNKDFGELGSLLERSEFEQVPKVYTKSPGMLICDLSKHTGTSPIERGQTASPLSHITPKPRGRKHNVSSLFPPSATQQTERFPYAAVLEQNDCIPRFCEQRLW